LKRSNRLVLLIGVFLAIVAFVGIVVVLSGGPGIRDGQTAPSAAPLKTVVAAQDIPLGATLTEGMLTTADFKAADRKTGVFGEPSQIVGQKVRRPITAGAQLTRADFLDIQEDLVVPEGKRAISIQVNQVNGVGTLIKTGDYVDLVLGLTGDKFPVVTLNPEDDSITVVQGLNSTSVKLLIEGMQVIGTIRPPTTAANRTGAAAPSGSAAQAPTTTLTDDGQELVILAVTAQQAELIKYSQIDGDISLLLRNSRDFLDAQGNPVVSLPAGTTGVILKTLVDGGYGVLRPELVEAIIPAQ
jgi:Flp pilus assembly protein CpaB